MRRRILLLIVLAASLRTDASQTLVRYAVVLKDPPLAEFSQSHQNAPPAAIESYRRHVETAQESLRRELGRRKFTVTGSVQNVMNAVFVTASPDRIAELRALPGVKAVVRMRRQRLAGR